MPSKCLVCYSDLIGSDSVAYLINDDIQFPSGKKILELFTKIFDVTIREVITQKHSKVICRTCLINFVEFDEYTSQLMKLKAGLKHQYQSSLKQFILADTKLNSPVKNDKIVTIKVPAKKMVPLTKKAIATKKPEPTPTTSSETDSIILDEKTFSELMKLTPHPMLTIDGLTDNVTISARDSNMDKALGFVKIEPMGAGRQDGDKDCGFTLMTSSQNSIRHSKDSQQDLIMETSEDPPELGDSDEPANKVTDKYVIDKVEIVNEDTETIMMESEDGSVISVVSGKELFYRNNEISLILPSHSTQDKYDVQDSTEESQIELQMSGDEETANAIIAATKEQGGAFIKTDSGEMYRVEAVKSSGVEIDDINIEDIIDINDTQTEYTCLLCRKTSENEEGALNPDITFNTSAAICKHLKTLHKLYVCVACRVITDNATKYTKHLRTHDKTKGTYQCTECFKRFSSQNLLTQHMNQHTGSKPFSCPYCDKYFANKYTCQTHLKIHQERPRPYTCKTCKKSFLSAQNLTQHMKTHSGIKDFVCNVCDKGFAAKHNLEVHSVVHSGEKPFICGMCNKGFARKAEIRDHIRTHTGERPYVCESCGAAFSQRSNLLSHVRATHLDDRRYHCHQCDKRFKRRRLLLYHIKATHTGERPFTCEECNATFVYPEHYKKHLNIHTGVRPFICEVCGKTFNSRDNRNAHRFTHLDKKPYECLVCGAGFMRKPHLYTHMALQGHMSESIVVNEPHLPGDIVDGDTTYEAVDVQESKSVNTNSEDINLIETADLSSIEGFTKGSVNIDASYIDNNTLQNMVAQDKVLSEGTESVVRLVQIQLPNGNNGWIALDQ